VVAVGGTTCDTRRGEEYALKQVELNTIAWGGECMETSYHLVGTKVTGEDNILRRQKRYRRGGIMGGAGVASVGGSRRRKSDAPPGIGGSSDATMMTGASRAGRVS
jgi:hypothetical protein